VAGARGTIIGALVGDKCPSCHKDRLERGVMLLGVVQVFCPTCGFMTDRREC